jgi:hypothetical protein
VVADARFYGLEAKVDELRRKLGGLLSTGAIDITAMRTVLVTADYTFDTEMAVLADATAGVIIVTLPPVTDNRGRECIVKKTDASAYVVTVDGVGTETIDGAATVALGQQYEAVHVLCDGTQWLSVGVLPRLVWHLSAPDFGAVYGSPSPGLIVPSFYGPSTWRLDADAFESIGLARVYGGLVATATVEVDVWYAMESATSGNVIFIGTLHPLSDGGDVNAEGTGMSVTSTVPGTAKLLKKAAMSATVAVSPGQMCSLSFGRWANNAGDTATGDCHIMAATVRFK